MAVQSLRLHAAYTRRDLRKVGTKQINKLGSKMPNNSAIYIWNRKTLNAILICKFSGGVWRKVLTESKNLSTWLRINLTLSVIQEGIVRTRMIEEILEGHPRMLEAYAEKTRKSIIREAA